MKTYNEVLRHDNQVLNLVEGPVRVLTLWFNKKGEANRAKLDLGNESNVVFTRLFTEPHGGIFGKFRVIAWRTV